MAGIFIPFHLWGSGPGSDEPWVTLFALPLQELARDRATDSYLQMFKICSGR